MFPEHLYSKINSFHVGLKALKILALGHTKVTFLITVGSGYQNFVERTGDEN